MNALEIKNLTKIFPDFELRDFTLTLPGGCIMGLIGENGAGKSTVLKLILGMLHKDGGSVTILGRSDNDLRLAKEDIGIVMDEIGIPGCLTAVQVGRIMSGTFQSWDSGEYDRLLNELNIPKNKAFKDFSQGMKMKLGLCLALSHRAKLLLLDEATNGLDPVARDQVTEILNDFTRDENHSILISSHIVSDLEKLCDYVAFLHKGRLLLCEEKDRLLEEYAIVHCEADRLEALDADSVLHKKVSPYGAEAIVKRNSIPSDMAVSPVSVEELFIYMVKEAK